MIRHVSGIAEIVDDLDTAVGFYERLGLKVRREMEDYAVVEIPGVLHFGLWPRRSAAESTYGDANATEKVPLGFTLGIEVDDVDAAADTLENVAREPKDEPWGQRTVRFTSPSGALCELSQTPGGRRLTHNVEAAGDD